MAVVQNHADWLISFHESVGARPWLSLFTRPGYRHCCASRWEPLADAWVHIDWNDKRLHVEVLPRMVFDALMLHATEVISVPMTYPHTPFRMLPFMSCVEWMKHLTGTRQMFVMTPWQLRCALLKRGAVSLVKRDIFLEKRKWVDLLLPNLRHRLPLTLLLRRLALNARPR